MLGQKNHHTAGFVVPLKETFAAIGVSIEEKDGLILLQDKGVVVAIDPKECSYETFDDEEDLRKHNEQCDYLSNELPVDNNRYEENGGLYPWLYCEYSEAELFVDNMTMQFLLKLANVDENIIVDLDYSKGMIIINRSVEE